MERFKRAYAAFEDYLAGGLLFIGLALVLTNVILRYFFGHPQSWIDEYSVYFVVWGVLIGIAVALRDDHHIKVELLFNFLPLKIKRYVSIFANLVGLGFCGLYTFYGCQLVQTYMMTGQNSVDTQTPMWIINLIIPISGFMLGIRFIEKLFYLINKGGSEWLKSMQKGDDLDGHNTTI